MLFKLSEKKLRGLSAEKARKIIRQRLLALCLLNIIGFVQSNLTSDFVASFAFRMQLLILAITIAYTFLVSNKEVSDKWYKKDCQVSFS